MESNELVSGQNLQVSFAHSIDVSGAFDNCFFHCYAAHLLANGRPLAEDLFNFHSILGDDSPASRLKALFQNQSSFNLFADYEVTHHPGLAASSEHYLVEKTLVLGFMLREWFATQMLENLQHRESTCDGEGGIVNLFSNYKELRTFIDKEQLLSQSNLLEANQAFLEYMLIRPKNDLSDVELGFERYFIESNSEAEAYQAYWRAEGYEHYCKHIASSGVKLIIKDDIEPVLQSLGQAMTLFASDATVMCTVIGQENTPLMEIKLAAEAGHYHLIKKAQTTAMLNDYQQSYHLYKEHRKEVLEALDNKDLVASQKASLLVASICPSGHLQEAPFDALYSKLQKMRNTVNAYEEDHVVDLLDLAHDESEQIRPDNNYSFLLKLAAAMAAITAMTALVVVSLAIFAVLSIPTAGAGSLLALSVVAAASSVGFFRVAQKTIEPNEGLKDEPNLAH